MFCSILLAGVISREMLIECLHLRRTHGYDKMVAFMSTAFGSPHGYSWPPL